ncbi:MULTISPECIES: hypothetical protein [unclassified Novosphingobium]|uniref:hypothetical protein n=1 Tax=Novosphingobium TaxID=165696 RepID=UPI001445AD43|nr:MULTISPECIES: hypothetical protein [unclassified Novosphingobium]NKJ41741.1 hypothetical protein [Novosphingobium sp. SG720]NMN04127.1 hypothetical protein [Novosphingobium sp. SG919]NMN85883.1 hypothetical protein [Novosphingobium sp. SG916]
MDWFSGIGRRVWLAYQEGLEMTCPAHRECGTRFGQIAARDSASALPQQRPTEFSASFTFGARIETPMGPGNGGPNDDGITFHDGSSARH